MSQSDKHAIPGQYDRCCEQREHGIVGASQPLKISGPETGCHQFTKNWLGRKERENIKKENMFCEQELSYTYQTHQTLKDKPEH